MCLTTNKKVNIKYIYTQDYYISYTINFFNICEILNNYGILSTLSLTRVMLATLFFEYSL